MCQKQHECNRHQYVMRKKHDHARLQPRKSHLKEQVGKKVEYSEALDCGQPERCQHKPQPPMGAEVKHQWLCIDCMKLQSYRSKRVEEQLHCSRHYREENFVIPHRPDFLEALLQPKDLCLLVSHEVNGSPAQNSNLTGKERHQKAQLVHRQ